MEDILFLDIETVPVAEHMVDMSEDMQTMWDLKFQGLKRSGMFASESDDYGPEDAFFEKCGVYAEFAKVVCISVGFIHIKDNQRKLRIKSFASEDEKVVLEGFADLVRKFIRSARHRFCGHNIKEFDMPFISRRMIVNGVEIPREMNLMGKKPWETNLLDTMEMWKFGDFKSYTSLKLLTALFGIPSPKDDIDGSEVAGVYYFEKDLSRIVTYCQKDVLATVQVYLRMNNLSLIDERNVEIV